MSASMTKRLKYVRTHSDNFIIFGQGMKHCNVCFPEHVHSAGMCEISVDNEGNLKFEAFGKSASLDVESDPNDSKQMTRYFQLY